MLKQVQHDIFFQYNLFTQTKESVPFLLNFDLSANHILQFFRPSIQSRLCSRLLWLLLLCGRIARPVRLGGPEEVLHEGFLRRQIHFEQAFLLLPRGNQSFHQSETADDCPKDLARLNE